MIAYNQLQVASSDWDADKAFLWKMYIRQTDRFKNDPVFFFNLDSMLADENLSDQQKKGLNILASQIEKLDIQVSVSGGEDAVRYSMDTNRQWLIGEGIDIIYYEDEYFTENGLDRHDLAETGQRNYPYCQ